MVLLVVFGKGSFDNLQSMQGRYLWSRPEISHSSQLIKIDIHVHNPFFLHVPPY